MSHTGVLGAFEHWRNIDDAQLRAVADKGGCVGRHLLRRATSGATASSAVVKHMLHILDVVGEDGPALGSDWDGMIVPDEGPGRSAGPAAPDRRAAGGRGAAARVIGKILRGNVMRVLDVA